MGDRANICVKDRGSKVYLYTHWDGTNLPVTVQKALTDAKGENSYDSRWKDGSYLARIIFSRMVKDNLFDLTGYGISSEVGDGDDRIVFVNCDDQEVGIGNKNYSFVDYCDLTEPRWYDNGQH